MITSAYKIQNKITGMVYIGVSDDPHSRWNAHITSAFRYNEPTELYQSMRKYGIDAFDFQVIAQTDIVHKWELEKLLIEQYDSFNCGYNMTLGGNDRSNLKGTAPARIISTGEHIGQVSLTDPRWEYEIESVFRGKTNSEETRQKLSQKRRGTVDGKDNYNAKRFLLISPEGNEYETHGNLKKFCLEMGLSYSTINNYINSGPVPEVGIFQRKNATTARLNTTGWQLIRIV
ncbi:hypothetical protein BRM13314_00126 [Salmonella phage BRM 13314]|nr:hypothetical protein BRM13314_00126 [Salmonella phage BRM 13314]